MIYIYIIFHWFCRHIIQNTEYCINTSATAMFVESFWVPGMCLLLRVGSSAMVSSAGCGKMCLVVDRFA
jgi:hypothetical protein